MNKRTIEAIFKRFANAMPTPSTELIYHSEFELLVAVVLSAQSTDKGVNKATAILFPIANTPEKIIDLGFEKFKSYIKTIGLFNTKAKNIFRTCEILLEKYHGEVPKQREALESLPGVGRKTANVLLNTLFGEPTIAVDTHIFRVANRIGLTNGKTPRAVEDQLMKCIPKEYLQHAHHWLILHGRYTCTARNPKCADCIIRDLCEFKKPP